MTKSSAIILVLLAGFLAMPACESLHSLKPNFAFLNKDLTSQGPDPLIRRTTFEQIDLVALLDPDAHSGIPEDTDLDSLSVDQQRRYIERAIHKFDVTGADDAKALRRNSIQERILAASNQRCNEYKKFLRQFEAEGNFLLGTATTVLGGLGAIFTPAATVRALSGSAAITSGTRAEFQEDFFQRLATHVITAGIDARRQELYRDMKDRQKEPYLTYTVSAAINDAVTYHSACNTVVGLQAANDSIQKTQDPGLKQLRVIGKEFGLKLPSVLALTPESLTTVVEGTQDFHVAGGVGDPYTFTVLNDTTGGASISRTDKTTARYTAGGTAGTSLVVVTDGVHVAHARVAVNPALAIEPATVTLAPGSATKFTISGGVPPYTVTIKDDTTDKAKVNADGTYTAGAKPGRSTVRVTDALGGTKEATVTVGDQ